jgi:ribonuclease Y
MTPYIAIIIFGVLVGSLGSYLFINSKKSQVNSQKSSIIKKASDQAKKIEQDASSEIQYKKNLIEDLEKEYDSVIPSLESRLENKQGFLQKRESKLEVINQKIKQLHHEIDSSQEELSKITDQAFEILTKNSGASIDETKEKIKQDLEIEFSQYFGKEVQAFAEHISNISVKKAQEDLKVVMQKYSEPSSTDRLDKHIELISPKEVLRVAGSNQENFQYLHEVLGVDIEIDEVEPNLIRVSGFILWNQEIAKTTLERMSKLSHIDKEIVDKIIKQSTAEMNQHLMQIGKEVARDIHLEGLSKEFLTILGKLQYRTSYGQNILFHSFEVAFFSQIIASLVGEDPRKAFLAGFFHDIGKAIDQDQEGTHDLLGKELLEENGFEFEIYHPAHSHHYLVPVETTIGEIVIIADKISAGRPGARAESAEMYYERMKGLERIATEQPSVKKAYAISAGREIRTFIDEKKVSDKEMEDLANTIAHQIESELTYPGQIKVNLIRTIQSSDFANKK